MNHLQELAIAYLREYLSNNKARGMLAELAIEREVGDEFRRKFQQGAWIFSPYGYASHRMCSFVLPILFTSFSEVERAVEALEADRGWQTLATFLTQSSIGVIVSAGTLVSEKVDFDALRWWNFVYRNERLIALEGDLPFQNWHGNRGRANKARTTWTPDIIHRFRDTSLDALTSITLRQIFYYSYLKKHLKKPLADPYDVDGFIVSYSGRVFPLEMKEKSRTSKGEFGVDAGRILMLLRLCLLTDSNALYLIREVDEDEQRSLIGWRYITLSDLVMKCRWNLQSGGVGMGGGGTQTIMMSAEDFSPFTSEQLQERWLTEHGSLQQAMRQTAQQIERGLAQLLGF